MVCSSWRRRAGARRNHSSLKARMLARFSSPARPHGGAVEPVPALGQVERVEELVHRLRSGLLSPRRPAVPDLVERRDAGPVQQPGRHPRRGRHGRQRGEGQRVGGGGAVELVEGGEPALGEHRPAQGPAGGQQVDPRHRVGVVGLALGQQGHDLVEVGAAVGVDDQPAGLDGRAPEGGVGDDAGQAQPAGGGPEQLGVVVGPDLDPVARGQQQAEPGHVLAPRPAAVVVLAVDVGGHRPAHRHLPGPGGDGHEPAPGHEQAHQGVEAGAGLGRDQPRRRVEGHLVELGQVDDPPAGVLGGVAVAAAQAAGDDAPVRHVVHGAGQLVVERGVHDLGPGGDRATPAGEHLPAHRLRPDRRHTRR